MSNILYLLNHKTLTDFECPILIKNNIYPYIPKKFVSLSKVNSINYKSIYFYDNFLDLPIDTIQYFNTLDWFKNNDVIQKNINLINKYFKAIFITLLVNKDTLTYLINNFKGKIYFRFFGLEERFFYYDRCKKKYGDLFLSHNVNFIFSYKEIIDFEKSKYNYLTSRNHAFIPLGLSNNFFSIYHNTYNPTNNKIIFVCSRIDDGINSYYGNIYKKFLIDFKNYDFTIIGKNNSSVDNESYIKNNLSDNDFYREISNHKCMFYHSNEPRHLHYHPLEAFIIGVPVVFSCKSLLTTYIKESPAIYKTIEEAKNIIDQILNNDVELIKEIQKKQEETLSSLMIKENINIFNQLKINE